jgi:F0F1-type ATP synthase membrane subunit c/vacuolar-type H+-ATPase subunit K
MVMTIQEEYDQKAKPEVSMGVSPFDALKKAHRQATLIGVAMISSLFIYVIVVESIKSYFQGITPLFIVEILRYLLFGLAFVEFFLIGFLRKRLLSFNTGVGGPSNQEEARSPIQRLLIVTIISYALCESVAIYGVILFLIGGSRLDFYIFLILSLIYFAVYFPRYNRWEEWSKRAHERVGIHSL